MRVKRSPKTNDWKDLVSKMFLFYVIENFDNVFFYFQLHSWGEDNEFD